MKLTQDQKEILRNLAYSEDWQAVIAYAQVMTKNLEDSVLQCPLDKPRELLIRRAQLDGAKTIIRALESAKANLKIK